MNALRAVPLPGTVPTGSRRMALPRNGVEYGPAVSLSKQALRHLRTVPG